MMIKIDRLSIDRKKVNNFSIYVGTAHILMSLKTDLRYYHITRLLLFIDSGEGTWGEWGPWIQQSCAVTCCGTVQYEARKRDCPAPRRLLCRDFPGCQGDPIQSRTAGTCNEIDCPGQ